MLLVHPAPRLHQPHERELHQRPDELDPRDEALDRRRLLARHEPRVRRRREPIGDLAGRDPGPDQRRQLALRAAVAPVAAGAARIVEPGVLGEVDGELIAGAGLERDRKSVVF